MNDLRHAHDSRIKSFMSAKTWLNFHHARLSWISSFEISSEGEAREGAGTRASIEKSSWVGFLLMANVLAAYYPLPGGKHLCIGIELAHLVNPVLAKLLTWWFQLRMGWDAHGGCQLPLQIWYWGGAPSVHHHAVVNRQLEDIGRTASWANLDRGRNSRKALTAQWRYEVMNVMTLRPPTYFW